MAGPLDIEPWEPEETVGKLWHAFASRLVAPTAHDGAAVELDAVAGRLAVLFRGLGGHAAVDIGTATREASTNRRSWRQRLGTTHEKLERSSFDGEALRLPARIAVFPEREDNAALYFWLVAAAAHALGVERHRDPLAADVLALRAASAMTLATLDDCPGLRPAWQRLASLCLAARPVHRRPRWEAAVEAAIRNLLGDPAPLGRDAAAILACGGTGAGPVPAAPSGYRPPAMVPLWPQLLPGRGGDAPSGGDEPRPGAAAPQEAEGSRLKARRAEADQAERRDSLILHKFEAIFSWAEFLNINRKVEDDDEEGARKAAEDADEIGLGQVSKRPATRLKLHLDLAPSDVDRERLSGIHLYPEWDQRAGAYLPDHARVLAAPAEPAAGPAAKPAGVATDPRAQRRIRAVRRQFEALRPARLVVPRQIDGDEIDLDAAVRARVDLRARGEGSDRLWIASRPERRSLAVSILLDASRSTESACGDRSVIDIEKEALTALAWGLDACGDETAIRSFSSLRRNRVYVGEVKDFDEPMGPSVVARIACLRPGFYTRMGAAIRHVSAELAHRPRQRRLLLVVSDGKPNDLDHYEGRHGIEDSRMAVREARRMGHAVHGVVVAHRGENWFARIFGRGGFSVVPQPERLTAALPDIYRHLVGA